MEQYKFRGKSLTTGEWLVGSLYDDGGEEYIIPNIPGSAIDYELYQVDGNTIGMFSGLKDRNGKEIFEGDIICHHEDDEQHFIKKIYWKDGCLCGCDMEEGFESPIYFLEIKEFYVIGNIYDNPELLKRK